MLILGCLVYVLLQGGVLAKVYLYRQAPAEVDDSYIYMLKAAELDYGLKPSSPAINSLKEQCCVRSGEYKIDRLRYRTYLAVLYVYDPLYSITLWLLNKTGMGWEVAYASIRWLGSIFIAVGILAFMRSLWGNFAAGVGMALIGMTVFDGQGICYVVPSNITMGLAFLLWAYAAGTRVSKPTLLAWVIALAVLHPVGRLLGVIAVILYAWSENRYRKQSTWLLLGVATLIVAAIAVYFRFYLNPELAAGDPSSTRLITAIHKNIEAIPAVVKRVTFAQSGGLAGTALVVLAALMSIDPIRRQLALLTAILLGCLSAASLLHSLDNHYAELFGRIWVISALWLAGAFGCAMNSVLDWIQAAWLFYKKGDSTGLPATKSRRIMLSVLMLVLLMAVAWTTTITCLQSHTALRSQSVLMIKRQHMWLDVTQPQALAAIIGKADSVLYLNDVPMYFYMTHGLLSNQAIYEPALGPDTRGKWLKENKSLKYVVGYNPVRQLQSIRWGRGLSIDRSGVITIRSGKPLNALYLFFENLSKEPLTINFYSGIKDAWQKNELRLPAQSASWYKAPVCPSDNDIRISASSPKGNVVLGGIRTDMDTSLWWPWDKGMTLTVEKNGASLQPLSLDSSALWPDGDRKLRILSDAGATVMAEIMP